MNRRFFWLIPEFVKFRAVFETNETVVGVTDGNERRLFRKDTGRICFDEHEAFRRSMVRISKAVTDEVFTARPAAAYV